jgi:acyl dehydratase
MTNARADVAQVGDGMLRGRITDEAIEHMRLRIGYSNPTIRNGLMTAPWNTVATADAIRHYANGVGDGNPLFTDAGYAGGTRWGATVAPPGFESTMGHDLTPEPPAALHERTRKALRGVQLFNSGHEGWFFRPIQPGVELNRTTVVKRVEDKESEFAGRSVRVTNEVRWTDAGGALYTVRRPWYIHAERREVTSESKYASDEPASYTEDQLADIERLYDDEFVRGNRTMYFEDLGDEGVLPAMVKGPFTVTDLINFHMGAGWFSYGFPPLRLAHLNRRSMRGFYTRNEFNSWDTLMRIHWEPHTARKVGVPSSYDIGPIRWAWLVHYCTNWAGDDGWVYRVRGEFRRFNYMGDTTWITARLTDRRVDPRLGPAVELELVGTNQRGQENIRGSATILLPSRDHGPVQVPVDPGPDAE